MANEVTQTRTMLPISRVFAQAPIEDLGEGIRTALAQLSINQNVFGINHHGTYEGLPASQARQIEIVIVKSAKTQSKAFWEGGYSGGNNPPDCWSSNSVTPDAQVPVPVSKVCNTCPNDAFVTGQNGLKQKLCGDHKRLAIVPAGDLENEGYGGPMIFRIPAGSLAALDKYGSELKKFGTPYYAYTTFVELTIDPQKKVTKLIFSAGRPLTDDEAEIILKWRDDEKSARIVNEVLLGYSEEGEPAGPPVAAAPIQQIKTPQAAPPIAPAKDTRRVSEKIATAAEARQAPIVQQSRPVVGAQTINAAMGTPASHPVSQRVVQTATQPEAPITEEETEQAIPDEMNELFGDLINR